MKFSIVGVLATLILTGFVEFALAQSTKAYEATIRVEAPGVAALEHKAVIGVGSSIKAIQVPSRAKRARAPIADNDGIRLEYTVKEITAEGSNAVAVMEVKLYRASHSAKKWVLHSESTMGIPVGSSASLSRGKVGAEAVTLVGHVRALRDQEAVMRFGTVDPIASAQCTPETGAADGLAGTGITAQAKTFFDECGPDEWWCDSGPGVRCCARYCVSPPEDVMMCCGNYAFCCACGVCCRP